MIGRLAAAGLAVCLLAPVAQAADPLGRLFTTPLQRKQLDDLREAQRDSAGVVVAEPVLLPEDGNGQEKAEEEVSNPIHVKGLVQRSDGQNTAWVNDSNTYRGDFTSEYMKVNPGDILSDEVRITLPDQDAAVEVKVGNTYDPATQQTTDLVTPFGTGTPAQRDPAPAPANPAAAEPPP